MSESRDRIREAIRRHGEGKESWRWERDALHALAIPHFAYQFEHNAPYRRFCLGRDITPETLARIEDIPAVPTDVFKMVRLSIASEAATTRTFRTSGTTQGARGAHHFEDTSVYAASIRAPFERAMFPDMPDWTTRPLRVVILSPDASALPDSSLCFMFHELTSSLPDVRYAFSPSSSGALAFDLEGTIRALEEAEQADLPVALLGTAFGFMQLLDGAPDFSIRLPEGSRLMETGGFKGKSREVSRETLYAMFHARLGIPKTHCVSEYSMTELSSQAYTTNLVDHVSGREPLPEARFSPPPWACFFIVDPVSLQPIEEPGQVGLVRWFDLANTESVMMVQTSDRGTLDEQGRLTLLGRAPEAELRGCSLTIEEIVEGTP